MAVHAHKPGRTPREHLARWGEYYWAPLLYTLAVYILYREVFGGERGFGWDTIESYWPDLVFLSEELKEGRWPLWNPFDRGGYPYAADPQPGIYYPVQWLCAALGMATSTGWWLIEFKMLLHHVIAALCLHAFLRHRGLPRPAALIGGLALIASTPWLIHKASNLLMPLAWAPLVWIAIDRILVRPDFRRAAFLAFAIYLAGSAGSPPGFFYVLVMSFLYGGFRAVQALRRTWRDELLGPYSGRLALAIVGAALLTLALLWVSVAPGLELTENSPRQTRDLGYALSMPLAMWPTLKALFVPTAGQVDAYCGFLVLLLALCAVALRPTRDRGAPIFFALSSVFFLSLSFGDQLPVLGVLVENLPGFGLFRISSRYKCVFAPMVAVLAGYGAWNLIETRPRLGAEARRLLALAIGSLALIAYLLLANPLAPQLAGRFPPWTTPLTLSLLAAGMVLAAGLRETRSATLLIACMPILLLGDTPRYWHHQQLFLEDKVDHREDLELVRQLDGVIELEARIYDEFVLEQRPGSRLHIRDFRGYPSGDPLDFRRYRDVLAKASQHPELLEAFNVRYVLHGPHHRSGKASQNIKLDPSRKSPQHFSSRPGPVREALHPAPLIAWYGAIQIAPADEVLDAMLEAENEMGERHVAVIEPDSGMSAEWQERLHPPLGDPPKSVPGTLVAFESDRVVVDIDAPGPGLVVLNEVDYPGWSVRVDGVAEPALKANYLLRAVTVGEGHHRIEWRYSPPGHAARIWSYRLALLALLLALASKLGLVARLRRAATRS